MRRFFEEISREIFHGGVPKKNLPGFYGAEGQEDRLLRFIAAFFRQIRPINPRPCESAPMLNRWKLLRITQPRNLDVYSPVLAFSLIDLKTNIHPGYYSATSLDPCKLSAVGTMVRRREAEQKESATFIGRH